MPYSQLSHVEDLSLTGGGEPPMCEQVLRRALILLPCKRATLESPRVTSGRDDLFTRHPQGHLDGTEEGGGASEQASA